MKVCIEGPNGVGKTTILNTAMAMLTEKGIPCEYVKLVPKNPYRVMYSDSHKFTRNCFKTKITKIGLDEISKLVLPFLREQSKTFISDRDKVVFYDRGVLSTYIYGFLTFQYITGALTFFNRKNIFLKDTNYQYLNDFFLSLVKEDLNKESFLKDIFLYMGIEGHLLRVDKTICLVPKSGYSKKQHELMLQRSKPRTIYEDDIWFIKNIIKSYKDFYDLIKSKDTLPTNVVISRYLEDIAGECSGYVVSNNYSNSTNIAEEIVRNISEKFKTKKSMEDK